MTSSIISSGMSIGMVGWPAVDESAYDLLLLWMTMKIFSVSKYVT